MESSGGAEDTLLLYFPVEETVIGIFRATLPLFRRPKILIFDQIPKDKVKLPDGICNAIG